MAFGKVDPKEVIGMTAEELSEKLGKIDSLAARFDESDQKTGAKMDSILSSLESLKPKPKSDPDPEETDLIDETRFKPLESRTLDNTIMLMHQEARAKYPNEFERWSAEILKRVNEYSVENRANPKVWNDAVMYVRGLHAADIERDGATGSFKFLEPVSAGLRPDPSKSDNLSTGQRLMVSKLSTLGPKGMTAEKYKAGQDRLTRARSARLGDFAGVEA